MESDFVDAYFNKGTVVINYNTAPYAEPHCDGKIKIHKDLWEQYKKAYINFLIVKEKLDENRKSYIP